MEQRLADLEKKLSFLEKLGQDLDREIFAHDKRIQFLEGRVRVLQDQLARGEAMKRQADEERPPHY